jgi:hypothetical protein
MRPVRAVNRFINEMKGNYEKRGDKVGERKIMEQRHKRQKYKDFQTADTNYKIN